MSLSLSDRIIQEAESLGPKKDELARLEKALTEATDTYDPDDDVGSIAKIEDLTDKLNALRPEVETGQKRLDSLRKAEQELAARAKPAAPAVIAKRHPDPVSRPGDLFVRSALVKAISHASRQSEESVIEQRFGGDDALKAVWAWQTKTAVMPADTTTVGWATELVRHDMQGFLGSLQATSVGAALASRSMMLNFAGASSVVIPRMNQIPGTMTEPAWVGEGGVIPLQQFSFGSATINRYKLASIVPMTMELVEQSTPQAEVVMRRAMEEAYALMLDRAILSGAAAVPGTRPAGLLQGVTPATGDTTGGYASVVADMKTMLAAMSAAGLGQRPVLILNDEDYVSVGLLLNPLGQLMFRDEVAGGRLMGVEVVHSRTATKGTAIMIDASALATAFDGPQFRISQEATLTMANSDGTAPTQAEGAAGAIGTAGQVPPDKGIHVEKDGTTPAHAAGYTAMSMFQTFSEAIRGIWPTSWALLRPGAVVAVNTLKW